MEGVDSDESLVLDTSVAPVPRLHLPEAFPDLKGEDDKQGSKCCYWPTVARLSVCLAHPEPCILAMIYEKVCCIWTMPTMPTPVALHFGSTSQTAGPFQIPVRAAFQAAYVPD